MTYAIKLDGSLIARAFDQGDAAVCAFALATAHRKPVTVHARGDGWVVVDPLNRHVAKYQTSIGYLGAEEEPA